MKSQKQMKENRKYVKITYLSKRERKTSWKDGLRTKLTLNHSSSVNQEEKW